ncbi:MAG TPA: sulfatase [Thermoanaerobaculia bacterium]
MRRWILPLAAALGAAIGCAAPPADNLLLVVLDTTRADRLSAYGYPPPTSPALAALAARGTLFTRAYAHVPSTLPSHASLFTGLLPPAHGVRANGRFRLAAAHRTLAEILQDAGFDTAAFAGALPIDARFGLDQGFALYDGDFSGSRAELSGSRASAGVWLGHDFRVFERPADQVTDRALAWLAERRERPWFLFVHYFDPHRPWAAPAPWSERFADPYDAEIAFADHQLGRLLAAVDALPGRTLAVVTADHGEGLGDHGEDAHNRYLYDSTLRVPLVAALAGQARGGVEGSVVDVPVAHVDVLPTVLELLGVAGGDVAGRGGRSLAAALRGAAAPEPRPIYGETLEWTLGIDRGIAVRALVDGRYKLVRSDVEEDDGGFSVLELYDLEADPAETANLARHDAPRRDRLAQALAAWTRRLEAEAYPAEGYHLDPETLEGLRSLGYLR